LDKDSRILIACEESGVVAGAFMKRGYKNVWSCDLEPTSGNHPDHHIQQDVIPLLNGDCSFKTVDGAKHYIDGQWDLIISFPPCTDIAVSGCRWFDKKRANGSQEKSIRFFFELWKYSDCTENPIGILNGGKYINKYFPELYKEMLDYGFPFKPSQTVHPYMFGDGERKATCLWLKNLPLLVPTNIVPIEYVIGKNGKKYTKTHYGTCFKTDRAEQGRMRSKTYPGLADAMTIWANKKGEA